jgi:hypothetical protein
MTVSEVNVVSEIGAGDMTVSEVNVVSEVAGAITGVMSVSEVDAGAITGVMSVSEVDAGMFDSLVEGCFFDMSLDSLVYLALNAFPMSLSLFMITTMSSGCSLDSLMTRLSDIHV